MILTCIAVEVTPRNERNTCEEVRLTAVPAPERIEEDKMNEILVEARAECVVEIGGELRVSEKQKDDIYRAVTVNSYHSKFQPDEYVSN